MRFLRQSFTPFAAIALLCGPLSACASNVQQPTTLPARSEAPSSSAAVTSPSPEPEAAATAPVLPAEAREQTAAGAIAFVRHYFAVVDYAYATGDTAPLAAVSDPYCLPCAAIKNMIDTTFADGDSYNRSVFQLTDLSVPDGEPLGAIEVHVRYSASGAIRLDPKGKEISKLEPAISELLRVVLVPVESGWQMYDSSEIGE